MTDLKELKKLVKFLKSEGITEYEDGGLKLKLYPAAPAPRKTKAGKKDVSSQVNEIVTDGPTQEDLLYWSADPAIAAKYAEDNNDA